MEYMKMEQTISVSGAYSKTLYRVAAIMALLIVLAGLIDAVTSMGMEAQDNRTIAITEWFTLFQTHRFAAFSRLGLINIITLSLGIPIYLAFNQAFRQQRPALAAFASILFFTGTAVYLSSNTVFPLFALSQQYAAAPAAQKPLLEAAGQALLAQGADLTPGTFFGLFFAQAAGLLITSAMLRGPIFSKWAGRAGLAGFSLMSVFFILTAFVPERYDTAMLIAAPGALLMIAYQLILARRFFQLSK
jgi:hypothetical protein